MVKITRWKIKAQFISSLKTTVKSRIEMWAAVIEVKEVAELLAIKQMVELTKVAEFKSST